MVNSSLRFQGQTTVAYSVINSQLIKDSYCKTNELIRNPLQSTYMYSSQFATSTKCPLLCFLLHFNKPTDLKELPDNSCSQPENYFFSFQSMSVLHHDQLLQPKQAKSMV